MQAPLHRASEKSVVCAIDFGTSGSGYGFSIDKTPTVEQEWEDATHASISKTLTQLLYDGKKLVTWGFPARKTYYERLEAGGSKEQLTLVEYFKLALSDNPTGKFTPPHSSYTFDVLDLVSDYLKQMWEIIKVRLEKVYQKKVLAVDIKWCISIPAIWKDAEKDIMRKAAVNAGLIPSANVSEDHFILVLEPEAAALCCMRECGDSLVEGTTFLVVDAGGGTVDLTSHQVCQGRLKEITIGDGGKFGSSKINEAFCDYLNRLIGKEKMDQFASTAPEEYFELMNSIETIKCQTKNYKESRNLRLPISLVKLLPPNPSAVIPSFRAAARTLSLDSQALESIFSPILKEVEDLVQRQYDENTQNGGKPFDYLFLVGGLAESDILARMLEERFGKITKLRRSQEPIKAVIIGGVLLGCDPSLIRGRKMRMTYGVGVVRPFDPTTHSIDHRISIPGREGFWCKDYFDKFVTAGDDIAVDSCVEREYKPQFAEQNSMSLDLYHTPTPHKEAKYIDTTKLIKTDMSNTTGGLARTVKVKMYFGKSEVRVEAVESVSNISYPATVKFDGMQVSFDGPVAPIHNPPKKYHIIFVNDTSSSMGSLDAKPSLPWITPISLLDNILAGNPASYTPIAFFMTDGKCEDGGAAEQLATIMAKYTEFTLHTVLIAPSPIESGVLKQLAELGKGKFFFSTINLESLKQVYTRLAALLE